MAVYFVTGKLGSGKSLCAVGKIKDYLERGRRVATNLNLNLDKMLAAKARASVVRVPDYPRACDLEGLGFGDPESKAAGVVDESKHGLLVLDELAMQFNTRNWRDKDRIELTNWFRHARKLGWDVMLLAQDIESVDGQLVNALCEHLVVCRRMDKLSVPFVSSFLRLAGIEQVIPKVHLGTVYYAQRPDKAFKVARWWYRAKDLYPAYDTRQSFSDGNEVLGGEVVDMRASYSVLPPYNINGLAQIDRLENRLSQLRSSGKQKRTAHGRPLLPSRYSAVLRQAAIPVIVLALSLSYVARGRAEKGPDSAGSGGLITSLFNASSLSKNSSAQPEQKVVLSSPAQSVSEVIPVVDPVAEILESGDVRIKVLSHSDYALTSLKLVIRDSKRDIDRVLTKDQLVMAGYIVVITTSGVEIIKGGYRKSVGFS